MSALKIAALEYPEGGSQAPGKALAILNRQQRELPNGLPNYRRPRGLNEWRPKCRKARRSTFQNGTTPREVGEVWKMTKSERAALCSLFSHPTRRAEIRLTIDGELYRSEASNDTVALIETAMQWRDGFIAKGWQ